MQGHDGTGNSNIAISHSCTYDRHSFVFKYTVQLSYLKPVQ